MLREAAEEARLLPETHPARTLSVDALAAEMMVQGRLSEAADLYDQSIALRRRLDGGRPEDLADALGSLGYVRLMQERPEDAEALFLESHALFEKGGVIASGAGVLMAAGTAAARRGDKKLGFERRRKALDIVLAQPNPHPIAVGLFKFKLADSYADIGDFKTAEAMESEAIEQIKKIRPEGHYQRLNSEITLGWIQALDGRGADGAEADQAGGGAHRRRRAPPRGGPGQDHRRSGEPRAARPCAARRPSRERSPTSASTWPRC